MKTEYLVILIGIIGLLMITGCGTKSDKPDVMTQEPDQPDTPIGGERDEHGCLGSAGYTWCESKQKCLRTWEEPCEEETLPEPVIEPEITESDDDFDQDISTLETEEDEGIEEIEDLDNENDLVDFEEDVI